MILKLTNAIPAAKGEAIAINMDLVVSIREGNSTREDGTIDLVTFIFVPPHGTWEVTETVDTILEKIKNG
jgi:shikimate kinase